MASAHVDARVCAHACMHACVRAVSHERIVVDMHACRLDGIHMCSHTFRHTCKPPYSHSHRHTVHPSDTCMQPCTLACIIASMFALRPTEWQPVRQADRQSYMQLCMQQCIHTHSSSGMQQPMHNKQHVMVQCTGCCIYREV